MDAAVRRVEAKQRGGNLAVKVNVEWCVCESWRRLPALQELPFFAPLLPEAVCRAGGAELACRRFPYPSLASIAIHDPSLRVHFLLMPGESFSLLKDLSWLRMRAAEH